MEAKQAYYLSKLKEDLSLRQRQNSRYSLRAYARDIGVHPATLSQVLKEKRPLPLKDSTTVIARLNLGPKERTLFMESLLKGKCGLDQIKIDDSDERFMLDESHHKVVAEWEHYAVMELYNLSEAECSVEYICRRFGISATRAEVVLHNLLTCGLLKLTEDGKIEKVHTSVRTTEDVVSQALKDSHKEALKMGAEKLDEIEVALRDFSSLTVALDPKKLLEAKTVIREFRQKMAALLRDGDKTDVYQLAIQFYPLTVNELN